MKTAKSIDVVRRALRDTPGGITVSTLKEAEYFFAHGVRDIVYAVGIAPAKFAHVFSLIRNGAQLKVIADNLDTVLQLAQAASNANVRVPVLIVPLSTVIVRACTPIRSCCSTWGKALTSTSGVTLAGVLTHAGDSYSSRGAEALTRFAERERAGAVGAAQRLRAAGYEVPIVSVGSTPTGTFTRDLSGVTEVRVGVYMFQDLVMAGIGVCGIDDIAVSVLVSVIGHQSERGWIITDGGWTSLSRDRGTATHSVDQGYGLVCDAAGRALAEDIIVQSTNQEHGILARCDGGPIDPRRFPVGTLLRVLPNHACATASQHTCYHVVDGAAPHVLDRWQTLRRLVSSRLRPVSRSSIGRSVRGRRCRR